MADNEIVMEFIIHNGIPVKVQDFEYSETKILPGVYEVIRIIDSVPLFLERHLSRFRDSAGLLGYNISISDDMLNKYIRDLIRINNCPTGNVKLIINNLNMANQDNYAFFIKSKYPSREQVEGGVPVVLFHGERDNPNAKSINLSFRKRIDEILSSSKAYEALLVNKEGQITEGSRSNFFIVKGNNVYTSPLESVLPGVTRHIVLDLCKRLHLNVLEKEITIDTLGEADGLFITGTSPQVLPISSVDGRKYNSASNSIISSVRKAYEDEVERYIRENK